MQILSSNSHSRLKSTDFDIYIPTEAEFKEVSFSNSHKLKDPLTLFHRVTQTLCCPCQTSILAQFLGRSFPRTYWSSSISDTTCSTSSQPTLPSFEDRQETTTSTSHSSPFFIFIPVPPLTVTQQFSSPLYGQRRMNFFSNLSLWPKQSWSKQPEPNQSWPKQSGFQSQFLRNSPQFSSPDLNNPDLNRHDRNHHELNSPQTRDHQFVSNLLIPDSSR